MDPLMQQKCDSKLRELQKCMPFLLRVLEKLRNNNRNDPARQIQLEKIQKLYNLLNDKSQTFKWDLLVKCENVVNKLQRKMETQIETEIPLKSRILPVEETGSAVKETANQIKRDDLSCPESPPPQQFEDFKNIQPVVIPTERRCSPPVSSKHREQQNGERQNRKSGHTQHRHHHHHSHQRHKQHESSPYESSRDQGLDRRGSYNANTPLSYDEEETQNCVIDRYLLTQRKREEENRQNIWQRRNQYPEVHSSNISWPQKLNTPTYKDSIKNFSITIKQSTTKQTSTNVFSRLGGKIIHSANDNANEKASQFNTALNTETPPIIPDFLKSPPLSASDITLLLNESNTNSNPSEPVGISAIGTRRSTPATSTISKPITTNVDNNASLDMVRKKFALLTKTEAAAVSPPTNQAKTSAHNQTIPITPTDSVALNYDIPHSRFTVGQSYTPNDKQASPLIVPNTNVNVLPTLRPNDPRLRKTNVTINGNTSTLLSNNHIPTLVSRQIIPPNVVNPIHLMSPVSNASATPSTPSPIYGNIQSSKVHPLPIPFITTIPNQSNINDPRLQRSRPQQTSTSCTGSTPKRSSLVSGDSSDENWDLDDNARDVIFPQPRPFSNRNPAYNANVQSSNHHFGNIHGTTVPERRPSMCWDNAFPTTNNAIITPNRNASNFNFQGGLPNVDDPKSYMNTNWHAGITASPSLHYNANSHKHSFNDRLNVVQSNAPPEHQNYSVPRTYGAYKEARARAASEQAARKTTKEASPRKETIETENKTEVSTKVDTKVCASTSLDTTYRSTNLSHCELSKTIDFKIPKKPIVSSTLASTSVGTNEKPLVENDKEKTKPEIISKPEHKPDKGTSSQKETIDKNTSTVSTSFSLTTTATKEHIIEPLQPKSQRARFRKRNKTHGTPTISRENLKSPSSKAQAIDSDAKKASTTLENAEWQVIDEVGGSDSELAAKPSNQTQAHSSSKLEFLSAQPGRILKRRCTMIEKASVPEVDKDKLGKVNAMLFEDLQERERKKKSEAAIKHQTISNRRHGEICYDKTDDGCTVSTQNIITGKRRTRTKANFNEVQQGIAVFKHLKPSEQKKDSTTSAASPPVAVKERKKPGPKPKVKTEAKIEQEKVKMADKPAEVSGSQIRKRRKTLVDIETKTKTKKEGENKAEKMQKEEKEEKCENSSDALPNVTSIFDTFIQKILNPATNADELINKLRDILSQQEVEALLSVREAMLKKHLAENGTNKDRKDVDVSDEKEASADDLNRSISDEVKSDHDLKAEKATVVDSRDTPAENTIQTEAMHTRGKAPRRSELDRLHDDIRDMFISEGVLTATGKRMCTFVEPGSTKTVETEQNKICTETPSSPLPPKPSSPQPPRLRKTRVMLPTVKIKRTTTRRSLRKAQPIPNTEDEKYEDVANDDVDKDENTNTISCSDTSFSSDMTQLSSTTVATVSTISTVSTDVTTTSSSSYTKSDNEPLRPMPILKALKPIRSREEDEFDEWLVKHKNSIVTAATADKTKIEKPKLKRYKPCPKSKKPANVLLDDDDDADVEDCANDVEILCGRPKIKTELLDIVVPYEDTITNNKDDKIAPQNINPKWHWLSRYAQKCAVCKQKAVHISTHYKKHHPENYVSRLAPIILNQLKQQSTSINKPIIRLNNKKSSILLFRCPFCLQFKHTSCVGWLEHFITHTGEYYYECTLCHSSFNKAITIERHMKEKCAGLGGRYLHNDEFDRSCKNNEIKAHICHLCNFLRLGRGNLERHYMEQHGYDVKNINDSVGYVISLLKVQDTPIAKTIEELIKMETKLSQQYQSDIISLDDDDDAGKSKATEQDKPVDQKTEPTTTAIELHNFENAKETVIYSNATESEKSVTKKKTVASSTDLNTQSSNAETTNRVKEPATLTLSAPVSSAFMSTTDDSNDGETPSILARKLFIVDDETELCSKSPSKLRLGGAMSMTERLCQRLKEAEANTTSTSAQQRLKEAEANIAVTAIQKQKSNADENTPTQEQQKLTNENTPMQEQQKDAEEIGEIIPMQQQQKDAVENTRITPIQQDQNIVDENTAITPLQQQDNDTEIDTSSKTLQNQQKNADETPATTTVQSTAKQSENTQLPAIISKDTSAIESGGEIDLTNEEDDDGWEDIEIVETAPNVSANSSSTSNHGNKESKTQKNKINPMQKLSRFYATISPGSKFHKKTKNFKPLITIFSGANSVDKETNQTVKERPKTFVNNKQSSTTPMPATSSTSTVSEQPIITTSAPVQGFRPMIANLDDLLPDSPSTDPIELAPELAPSGPLQELNDISTFLGSNLSGLMDMDVEDPANSVCIHNPDNQQTSIQDALDFVASQTADYEVEQTLSKSLSSHNANDGALIIPPISMNRIQTIGYTCSTDSDTTSAQSNSTAFKFYCFSDRCTFLYSSEAIGLENHFLFEHPQSEWNGYCNTCASQIETNKSPTDLKFSDEFHHLLSVHLKKANLNTQSPALTDATTGPQNESNSSSNVEQPRLKLRRLSGDCLSTATVQSDSLSSTFMETYDDSNSFSDLIRFNPCLTTPEQIDKLTETVLPTTVECLPDDVPFFTNVSKDFEITSISSGLEPTELSAIVRSALSAETADTRNSCGIQISNVVSLREGLLKDVSSKKLPLKMSTTNATSTTVTTDLSLPKITNVCSLNSDSATRIGSLWSEHIRQERNEVVQSAAESMEISTLLANAPSNAGRSRSPSRRNNNDSPGPVIVSEILPAGQATTGDFVITQTVSAQYSEGSTIGSSKKPKLDFNISISSAAIANAKSSTPSPTPSTSLSTENVETVSKMNLILKPLLHCMEPSCKFTTRHFVATIDHIKWHEKKNDAQQHEYLRCSLCQQKLLTVDAFTQHLRIEHYSGTISSATPVTESPSTETHPISAAPIESCELTEKIRNILNQNQVEITAKEGAVSKYNRSSPKPNSGASDSPMQNLHQESTTNKIRLLQTIREMVAKTGLSENKLFRCSVKDCNVNLNENSYHTHVLYHLSTLGSMNNTFPCPHCKAKCQNISALKTHIKGHGRHRFFCYLCMETAVNNAQMSRHFAQKHWQKKELSTSILQSGESNDGVSSIYYVTNLSPLNENNIREFGKKLIIEWQRKKAATRTHFNPNEIELLPIQAIFSKEIYCAICLYKTKVRTNMVRHMIQHKNTPSCVEGSTGGSPNVSMNSQKDGNTNDNMLVCSMDPINPVPCLISKEKHFDRMTNLASSSLGPHVPQGANSSSGGNVSSVTSSASCKLRYSYVPQSKRFKCGVPGCEYLTICEDVFRSHLNAVHSETRSYKCLFCNEELCKRILGVEKIIQHLRFHDRTLYQCEQCNHNHYIRHIVDRHALEKHGLVARANILVFIRDNEGSLEGTRKVIVTYGKKTKDSNTIGNNSDETQNGAGENNVSSAVKTLASSAKSAQKFPKFICDLCEYKTITYNQLIAHSNSQHGFKQPYQCPYCLHFTAWAEQNVKTHITEEHPGEMLKVNRLFGKMNAVQQSKAKKEFLQQQKQLNLNEPPPKPLWQRDDPKRARQIRGIPMEDEEESEKLRKRLRLNDDYYDDDDGEEVVASASGNPLRHSASNLYLNRFEFGCFHCEYKSNSIDDLKSSHWDTMHSNMDGLSSKPFLFRLLNRFKCAECQNFVGCFWELQNHMTEAHAKSTSCALDPRAKKLVCGYCEYDCASTAQLLRHHLRDDHQPQDVKGLSSVEMAKVMRLECTSSVSFVHCTLCSEIFNSRLAVVQHAGEKHGDDSEHFSFRELSNKTIYRCSDCSYASTDELTTLRHMINHYRRFKRCNFCNQPQKSFNDYMQHCYSDHRVEIRRFSEIYPFNDIRKYLMQVLIIFPNGWIINKKNLRITPYGNDERLKTLYAEICKTSQEPPIPRLSLGRLVARKSIEAKLQQNQLQPLEVTDTTSTVAVMQLAGNAVASSKQQLSAQKISKRRSTIAVGNDDVSSYQSGTKRQKLSTHIVTNRTVSVPLPPKFKSAIEKTVNNEGNKTPESQLKPYSYYGKRPVTENWSKLHTKISIAGINTPITLDKFKILVQIDARLVLEKLDIKKYKLPRSISNKEENNVTTTENDPRTFETVNQYEHVKKACPASQKYRFT